MKKPYYLYTRKRKDGKKVFYVKFRSPEGEYLTGKSTGETDQSAAEAWAIEQIVQGRVRVRADIRFDAYAKDFFRWDGPYVKYLHNRGRKMGKSHAIRMNAMIENHLNVFFGKRKLSSITNRDIERWQEMMLVKPRNDDEDAEALSPTSINHSLICLRTILKQAVKDGYINSNPCQGVEKLATMVKSRGALTEEEGTNLFSDPTAWNDSRHYRICRLSYETGMRFGEVVALKRKYVENGWINVVHSWGRAEGLKEPKTRKSKRRLKVSTKLTSELTKWMEDSPFKDLEDFVFYTSLREVPYIDNSSINRALYNRLHAIGISENERKNRNLVFHSLRNHNLLSIQTF